MRRSPGQLSLFDVEQEPTGSLTAERDPETSGDGGSHAVGRSTQIPGVVAVVVTEDAQSRVEVVPALLPADTTGISAPRDGAPYHPRKQTRGVARRGRSDAAPHRTNGERFDAIEKHYRTREVAELLSVHEETVLRLAQCGSLRSVRIGSERRYAESAIVAFLESNVDESAGRLRVARGTRS